MAGQPHFIKEDQIGDIEIEEQSTYIEVPLEYVDEIYQACDQLELVKKSLRKAQTFC